MMRSLVQADTDVSPLSVREWGRPSAPTVVMVHGFVVSGRYFDPTSELLADRFALAAPDLPGYGASPKPRPVCTVPRLADALLHWLQRRGLTGSMLLANSFGCQVAAELAMRQPAVLSRLILVSPALDPTKRRLRHLLPAALRESATHSAALQKILLVDYGRAGIRTVLHTLRNARRDRLEDKLPWIDIPALVVWGTADPLVSREWAEAAADLLPQGRLAVVEGAPHAMNFEAPDELVDAIETFIAPGEE